jgi:hypothetical protein
MAAVFFDTDHPCLRGPNPGERRNPPLRVARVGLPMADIKGPLDDTNSQRIIPFFGAGASLHRRDGFDGRASEDKLDNDEIERICRDFGIREARSKRFIGIAVQFAQLMDLDSEKSRNPSATDESEAPSSWELANRLSADLRLEPFERFGTRLKNLINGKQEDSLYVEIVKAVAKLMELYQSIPQLLETASYYDQSKREDLLAIIRDRLSRVTKSTTIQQEFAKKAGRFVSERNSDPLLDKDDYLLITTNYDTLIEQQLESAQVPYCVVNVRMDLRIIATIPPKTQDLLGLSAAQFQTLVRQYEPVTHQPPNKFLPSNKTHSMAMVYKIHGSPGVPNRAFDNAIVADRDYIKFIQVNGSGNVLIPAYVKRKISQSRLLFLGYSFSDWNVRSLYEQIVEHRLNQRIVGEDQDYVVMRSYSATEHLFFNRWSDISILVTDLDTFATRIHNQADGE